MTPMRAPPLMFSFAVAGVFLGSVGLLALGPPVFAWYVADGSLSLWGAFVAWAAVLGLLCVFLAVIGPKRGAKP